jgi:putative membrane-bound dehydrogenase-like protein
MASFVLWEGLRGIDFLLLEGGGMRGLWIAGVALLGWGSGTTAAPQDEKRPLRVFIRAGAKTHGPGEHDHPRFLSEWKELLRARGAEAEGALEFPGAAQLEKTDVLVLYAAEGGTVAPAERERLDAYLKRGGGIVAIHDSVCGKDPQWFKTVIGGAWEHGKSKYHHGTVGIYVQDYPHPITQGVANFFIDDEIYWDLHLMPEAKVLATGFRTAHEITPQMWVYEKDGYRAFVSLQGHKHASFGLPHYRALLLRGIAWAGKRDVDLLVTKDEVLSLRYPEGGPTAPAKAREKVQVHPDFEAALVLSEPDVVKPISAGWDAKGRLWLALTPQYPNKASVTQSRPRDLIVYFEGAKRTVFYDQLDLVTSFVFHRDGVIVTQAPDILWLRDTDGDGRADRREVLFTGFGFGDTHATTSNLRWGQDGWVYGTQGYSGNASRVVNAAGKDFGKIGNGLFRFRPDGSDIEVVCSYGSNTWGMDFSWDNELFFTMANESHLRHVVLPDSVLARAKVGQTAGWKFIADHRDSNPLLKDRLHPYQQIDCVGGFTAAAGSTLYDGGAWPDEYRQVHFVTECTINLVHQDRVVPDGVTFKASKVAAEEFIAATDLWFRPIDTQIGPDGALYVLDFYNLAAVHNDTRGPRHGPYNAAVRPDRDHLHGRVWRVQHKTARALPAADFASTAGLVAALEHPNRWARLTAQRLLCERGEGAAEVRALLQATAKPETRVLCLWTLQRLGKTGAEDLAAALGDANAGVRKNAARIAGLTGQAGKALAGLLADADARVRLEALAALGSHPERPTEAIVRAYARLQDDWSRSAALGALAGVADRAFGAALRAGDRALAEELATLAGGRQDAALAASLVAETAAQPAEANALKAGALVRLARALKPDVTPEVTEPLKKALEALLASGDGAVVAATLPFASRWVKDESMAKALEPVTNALLASLGDASAADGVRAQNLATLLSIPSVRGRAIEAGAKLLEPSSPADLQRGVIEALGTVPDVAAGRALVASFRGLSGASRELILAQLLKRPEWTRELLAAIEQERLRPGDLGPGAVFRLRNHPDKATAQKAAAVIDKVQGGENKAKDQIIAQLLPAVEKPGDPVRGKALFAENCMKCHTYKGEGKSVAPDLTGMGVHPKGELLVHIVDPNRSVEGNYVSYNLRTKGGEVFNGLIAREGKESVTLKNNEGEREFKRSDIDALLSTGLSLMPTGLESLGAEALRDILTYLASEAGGFRVVDLQTAFTASTVRGLYDPRREPDNLRLKKYGIVTVDGIPFQLVDPAKSLNGNNAIVLKGGQAADWHCKQHAPQKVEVPVGFAFDRLHVLGGIAAWGTLSPEKKATPVVKVTFYYADGETDLKVLRDGVEFSDWIRRVDVPGSTYAPGLVRDGARGQVRWFTLKPSRKGVIHHLTLESYDNTMAPTFLALTAEVGGGPKHSAAPAGARTLIVGGGSSHDFDRWFKEADGELLEASYTADPKEILPALGGLDVLVLSNNQPIPDPAARKGIFDFVEAGKGLLLVHPATWYNWKDWPEYNRTLVGGGSRGHEKYQEFEVTVTDAGHPVTAGVPPTFRVRDELYRFEKDPQGPEVQVLARGRSLETGKEYPVVWTVAHAKGRVVCVTLGHDGAAHRHEAYRKLLKNARDWAAKPK